MVSSTPGGMILSLVPIRYHDGIVHQAGVPEGSESAPNVAGRCEAATSALSRGLNPVANESKTTDRS